MFSALTLHSIPESVWAAVESINAELVIIVMNISSGGNSKITAAGSLLIPNNFPLPVAVPLTRVLILDFSRLSERRVRVVGLLSSSMNIVDCSEVIPENTC